MRTIKADNETQAKIMRQTKKGGKTETGRKVQKIKGETRLSK